MAQRSRSMNLKLGKARQALTLVHPNAAGIDIGNASHFVAVPPERDDEPVREFPSFTADLEQLADWLQACGVDTVVMEVHRRVLDSFVRTPGRTWLHGAVGQCPACEERLGPQVRRAG